MPKIRYEIYIYIYISKILKIVSYNKNKAIFCLYLTPFFTVTGRHSIRSVDSIRPLQSSTRTSEWQWHWQSTAAL